MTTLQKIATLTDHSYRYPWKSGEVIGCIVAGVVVLVVFVLYGKNDYAALLLL